MNFQKFRIFKKIVKFLKNYFFKNIFKEKYIKMVKIRECELMESWFYLEATEINSTHLISLLVLVILFVPDSSWIRGQSRQPNGHDMKNSSELWGPTPWAWCQGRKPANSCCNPGYRPWSLHKSGKTQLSKISIVVIVHIVGFSSLSVFTDLHLCRIFNFVQFLILSNFSMFVRFSVLSKF